MPTDQPTLGTPCDVFRIFLRPGLTSFAGPITHLGYFRDGSVSRRQWLGDRSDADLVALFPFLPVRASSQVRFALGRCAESAVEHGAVPVSRRAGIAAPVAFKVLLLGLPVRRRRWRWRMRSSARERWCSAAAMSCCRCCRPRW